MRRRSTYGFTLVEILTVIVIILVVAGWIIAAFGPNNTRAARARAQAEITSMGMACETYKTDFGSYPRSDQFTEASASGNSPIDPLKDGNPTTDGYKKASLFLYMALSGDLDQNGKLTPPDEPTKGYMNFLPPMLNTTKDSSGNVTRVNFLQDPFGNSYGYSTAGAKTEDDFRAAAAISATAKRNTSAAGFNPTFDLWSTGGKVLTAAPTENDRNRWVKNW